MKVIKKDNKHLPKPKKKLCGECNSELEYIKSDIKNDRDGDYIICPVCNTWISVSNDL